MSHVILFVLFDDQNSKISVAVIGSLNCGYWISFKNAPYIYEEKILILENEAMQMKTIIL